MEIRIKNCRNKRLKILLAEAAEFFAKELMHPSLVRNLVVTIKLKRMTGFYGECFTTQKNKQKKPRKFMINISPHKEDPVYILAHEMVHVKQFAKQELSDCLTYWKSRKVREGTPYAELPWEKEAYGVDHALFEKFICTRQLKNPKSRHIY